MSGTKEQRVREARRLQDQNLTRDEIAERMGKSRSTIDKYLAGTASRARSRQAAGNASLRDAVRVQATTVSQEQIDPSAFACAGVFASQAHTALKEADLDLERALLVVDREEPRPGNDGEPPLWGASQAIAYAENSIHYALAALGSGIETFQEYAHRKRLRNRLRSCKLRIDAARREIDEELDIRNDSNIVPPGLPGAGAMLLSAAANTRGVWQHLLPLVEKQYMPEDARFPDEALDHPLRQAAFRYADEALRHFDKHDRFDDDDMAASLATMRSLSENGHDNPSRVAWHYLAMRVETAVDDSLLAAVQEQPIGLPPDGYSEDGNAWQAEVMDWAQHIAANALMQALADAA